MNETIPAPQRVQPGPDRSETEPCFTLDDPTVWKELDSFYFQQLISTLHPSLHDLARDRRLLRHTPEEDLITTLEGLYQPHYTLVPWILDDIFPVTDGERLAVGRAWFPLLVAFVIIDSIMDRQLDHVPAAAIIQQHYLLAATESFQMLMGGDGEFRSFYHARLNEMLTSLALEEASVGQGAEPYTWELMQAVNTGKSAPFMVPIYALAELSDRGAAYEPVKQAYSNLVLADQLTDDAGDWRIDFAAGRHTLATVLAQRLGVDFESGQDVELDVLYRQYVQSGAPAFMLDQALSLLADGRSLLQDHDWRDSRLDGVLSSRMSSVRSFQSRVKAARILYIISDKTGPD